MFVHAIRFAAPDPGLVKETFETWGREVAPGAAGWLGSTAGITPDGTFVRVARWESAEAFTANAERPETKAWSERADATPTGAPDVFPCPVTYQRLEGCSDDAGFVQVIIGRTGDAEALLALERDFESAASSFPPAVMGSVLGVTADGRFVETVYFTSEAEARVFERSERPAELRALFDKLQTLTSDATYHDLANPWLVSP